MNSVPDIHNHPRYRRTYPDHALMLADHPEHDDISSGHYFFYARNLGGHVQALHQSFATPILIPRQLCELLPPAQAPASAALPERPQDQHAESLTHFLEEHNRQCQAK